MKKVSLLLMWLSVILTINTQAQKQTTRFTIKSGYVKYEVTGKTTGTVEFWWDDYGAKSREITQTNTVTKIFGMKQETKVHTLIVNNKDVSYVVDYIEGENRKTNSGYTEGQQMSEGMTEQEQQQLQDDILASLGGQKIGTRMFMNKKCDLYSVLGTQMWIYKGLTLKSESNILGVVVNKTAIEFKPNTKVSASKFEKPAGVEFEDNYHSQEEGGIFGALDAAMQQAEIEAQAEQGEDENNDNDYDDNQEDERELVPTKYPYNKFITKANNFKYLGYIKRFAVRKEGVYMAIYSKGLTKSISIVITSRDNADEHIGSEYKSFTHKGKKCYYGTSNEEGQDGEFLVAEIAYDSFVVISASPLVGKTEMLKILDLFNF